MCFAVPGQIEAIDVGAPPVARVDFAGVSRQVALDFIPGLQVGDYVIAHAGHALAKLGPAEAQQALATMRAEGLLTPGAAVASSAGVNADVAAARPAAPNDCADGVCVTCSDEGRPGTVIEQPAEPLAPALVKTDAGIEEADVSLIGDVRPGDLVLIHAGVAICRPGQPADAPAGAVRCRDRRTATASDIPNRRLEAPDGEGLDG
jgi:hydrogenase assembly chaperone HypC/HupF